MATLCDKIEVELEISDIKFASRLGEQSPDSSRPLLIGFKDLKVKNDILNNAHKLSNSDDNDPWASVNVIQDLTKQQRKEELALRDEMKKKNRELSDEDKAKKLRMEGGRKTGRTAADQRNQSDPPRACPPWRGPGQRAGAGGGKTTPTS